MSAHMGDRAEVARNALTALYASLRERGLGVPAAADGQLIRPLLSLAGAESLGLELDGGFWSAAAAVQLAHEASLLHDDVIDSAATRRSAPTVAAARGIAVALVEGDHLLTTSYRLAAAAESPSFFAAFAHAVERTVAGEKLQGRVTGMELDEAAYRRIIAGKSGELLGCALAAGAYAAGHPSASSLYVLGRRIGELYQMLDDLLDYCPDVDTGKPALGDYRQQRWTWPLLELGSFDFAIDADEIARRFAEVDACGSSPLRRCVTRFEREVDVVRAGIAVLMPTDEIASQLVCGWRDRARSAAARVEAAVQRRRTREELFALLPDTAELNAFFAANSRTFSFAARAFPREFRERVTRVYAFCRVTDDLADGSGSVAAERTVEARLRRLELWRDLAHDAYMGGDIGVDLLHRAMGDARAAGVPFRLVDELIEGMRMDLRGERYATLAELRIYTYRVAGVVGQWLTHLCGVHDDGVLERAADLGHALQLTNILRDVGEDLAMGRLYVPARMMAAAGVAESDLHGMRAGAPITDPYRTLLEELMQRADEHYARALAATQALPSWFRHAVRIAAHVYRGIHDEVRGNDYDNLTRRAHTSGRTKLLLAMRALSAPREIDMRAQARAIRRPPVRSRAAVLVLVVASAAVLRAPVRAQSTSPAAYLDRTVQHVAVAPYDTAAHLDLVRALFFVAVEDEKSVVRGRAAIADMRTQFPGFAERHAALLQAYEGAFMALEAKHGFWPHARLLAVRRGLQRLDEAAGSAPADLEIRYLRMINGFYLPSLFGRRGEVEEDLAILERELPHCAQHYPAGIFRVMARFVLEHGDPPDEAAAALRDRLSALEEG